jgi:cobalt-precorrin 5A hydrolase
MRVAGFGFRAGASLTSLQDALEKAGGTAGLGALASPEELVSLEEKAPALAAFAARLGLPVLAISRALLMEQSTITRSKRIETRFGTGSVAEAAALAGAGPGARLLTPRALSEDHMATAAIAEGVSE